MTETSVFYEVGQERVRQDKKWGVQNHNPSRWMDILTEEVGEASKAILEATYGGKPWRDYRAEMIQIAAVAIAAIKCYDRHDSSGSVYLAGPIKGCDESEVHDWRAFCESDLVADTINPASRRDFSQTDCDDCLNEIVNPDKNDIDSCAVLLANVWRPSVGTSMEILYAWERGKLVVVVVDPTVPTSAWIIAHAHALFYSLADAMSYINGLQSKGGSDVNLDD